MQNDASYTLTDLLMDDSFRAWVASKGQEDNQRWLAWMEKHPHKTHLVEEARQVLSVFEMDTYELPNDRKESLRQKIAAIAQNQPSSQRKYMHTKKQQPVRWYAYWSRVAAAILVLLTLSGLLYTWLLQNNDRVEYRTAFGEIKEVQLPDGSQVTLNANSALSFSEDWNAQAARQVWLKGEAFFEVEKRILDDENNARAYQKFKVFTDNLVVEVLGTKFNVNNRHENTEVVLNSGSVKLQLNEQALLMQPGDYIAFSSQQKSITKKVINPEDYIAWKNGQLYFDGATVAEVKQTLADNYGVEIIFEDEKKTEGVALRGMFPTNDLTILLQALANTTQTEITKKENKVFYQ